LFEIQVIFYGYRDTRDGGVLVNILSREAACCPKTGKFLPYCTSGHDTSLLYISHVTGCGPSDVPRIILAISRPKFSKFF
jgi:hypothetical protein